MTTPVFQHGKNAFLALGYDLTATLTSGATAASGATAITLTGGTTSLTGEAPIINGGSRYGIFMNNVPIVLSAQPTSTSATLQSATPAGGYAGGTVLPMYNISPWANDISFPQAIETAETTTFSAAGVKTYIVGLKSYTITFSGHFDGSTNAIDQWLTDLIKFQDAGNFIPWVYGPASPGTFSGINSGDIKYYGVGLLTKYDLKSQVSGVVDFDGEIQVSGAVTRNTAL